MKILIITYLNSFSPGTFLQAYGLQKGLMETFPKADICFLNSKDIVRPRKNGTVKQSTIKDIIKQRLSAALRLLQVYYLQKKHFKIIGKKIELFNFNCQEVANLINKFDLLVIGSDTILENVTNNNNTQIGIMWPDDHIKIKRVYFSASAAPARFLLSGELKADLKERISKFSFIGLRDEITMSLFKNVLDNTGVAPVKQPDPTYFIDLSEFKLPFYYRSKLKKKAKYCLFTFNKQFKYRDELIEILKKENYTLVAIQYIPGVDICFSGINPLQWGSIFGYCDLIVTERFHDTVFALRHCKPVISVDWDESRFSQTFNSKTKSILKDYNLDNFHVTITDIVGLDKFKSILKNIPSFSVNDINRKNNENISLSNALVKKMCADLCIGAK